MPIILPKKDKGGITITYSVLMSVYHKEQPMFLEESLQSILNQTIPTDDFVLVCDGPLTNELDDVINGMQSKFGDVLHVVRLPQNGGLGNALNHGLKFCKNELVARMDSDDVSRPDRCEKQLHVFRSNQNISLSSGTVSEFDSDIHSPTGKRQLPISNEEIISFSRKRNPINHPCTMFKKSAVIESGGYKETFHLFEDYYLWVRMLQHHFMAYNLPDVLLDMRTPSDMYMRRGGKEYAKDMLRFHEWMKETGWTTNTDYITGAWPHAIVCVLPNKMRKAVYNALH